MKNVYYEQKYLAVKSQIPHATFGQILKETFGKVFNWNARSTRQTFWTGFITTTIIEMIVGSLWSMFAFKRFFEKLSPYYGYGFSYRTMGSNLTPSIFILGAVVMLVFIYLAICQLGLMVRRLHDINVSGWWLWLALVPTAGWVLIFFGLLFPTIEKPVKWNRYLSIDRQNK